MNEPLYALIKNLNLTFPTHERWAICGPEATIYQALWPTAAFISPPDPPKEVEKTKLPASMGLGGLTAPEPGLAGLLLIEVISQTVASLAELEPLLDSLPQGSQLIVADWRADTMLTNGPPLEQRVKQGRLRRRLREIGFGCIERLINHDLYYILRAIKEPAPVSAHAGEFVEVARLDDLPRNEMKLVELFGQQLIVANTGRGVVAFAQACPHAEGGDLFKGRLRGRNVLCPVHFYIWNVSTGEPVEPTDEDILPRYPVKVDQAGRIFVALPPTPA